MPTEHDWMLQRFHLQQLRQAHPDWSYRHYARELNASDKWVRDWCKRFAEHPPTSLEDYRGRSRAPKIRPTKIEPFVAEVVGALRETLTEKYHRPAGPTLIRTELQARPELAPFRLPTSTRTINRILHDQGYLQRRRKPKHLPLPLTPPMEEWEMVYDSFGSNPKMMQQHRNPSKIGFQRSINFQELFRCLSPKPTGN